MSLIVEGVSQLLFALVVISTVVGYWWYSNKDRR